MMDLSPVYEGVRRVARVERPNTERKTLYMIQLDERFSDDKVVSQVTK